MPKFLVRVKYQPAGAKGVLKDGGSGRRKAVEELMASVGGSLDAFYFTFGEDDAILIIDTPDAETALGIAITVRASGAIRSDMTPLIPVGDVDRAIAVPVPFHPPGSSPADD